jgi:integrase
MSMTCGAAQPSSRKRRTRAEAEAAEGDTLTVAEAVEQYAQWMRTEKGNRPTSVMATRYRLRGMLQPVWEQPARSLTRGRAMDLYRQRCAQVAVDTQRNELNQVRTFWRWAAERRMVRPGIWDGIKAQGQRSHGKEQLRPTEAQKVYQLALAEAGQGDSPAGAAAVLCALVLGLRASEIIRLQPRDVDAGLAFVERSKSRRSTRRVKVPEPLWSVLDELADRARHGGQERVFPFTRYWVRDQVKRLCRMAGAPEISAHGMRGLHATLATAAGATSELVAQQLGHASLAVTEKHYTDPEALTEAAKTRVVTLLEGGKRTGGKSLPKVEKPVQASRPDRQKSSDSEDLG